MELISLKIENYRQFRKKELVFQKGFNAVIGRNEAGKSTITRAFLDTLYLAPNSRSKEVQATRSWQNELLPRLELVFHHEGFECHLVKDFNKKSASMTVKDDKGKLKQIEGVEDTARALNRILPFKGSAIYLSSAFISADDISRLHTRDSSFVSAIQNVAIEGEAEVEVQKIVKELKKQKDQLIKGLEKHSNNPGPIRMALNEVESLEKEIGEAQELIRRKQGLGSKLEQVSADYADNSLKYKELEQELSDAQAFLSASENLARSEQEFNDAQDALEFREKLAKDARTLEESLQEYGTYSTQEVRNKLNRILQDRELAKVLGDQLSDLKKIQPVKKKTATAPFLAAGVLLLLGLLLSLVLANALFLILGVVLAAISYMILSRTASKGGPNKDSGSVLGEIEGQLNSLQEKEQETLSELQVPSLQRLQELVEKAEELGSKHKGVGMQLAILEEEEPEKTLVGKRKKALQDKLLWNEKLEQLPFSGKVPDKGSLQRLQRQAEKLKLDCDNLRSDEVRLLTSISSINMDMEELASLGERYELEKEKLQQAREELAVIELILMGLEEAIAGTASDSASVVEKEIDRYLPRITSGRYSRSRLNPDLSISVYSIEKGDWCDPREELSRGTLDQIYLLARMAFIRLLCQKQTVPVILDDPFLTFDEERCSEAVQLLQDFSRDFQVILFSFNKRLTLQDNVQQLTTVAALS